MILNDDQAIFWLLDIVIEHVTSLDNLLPDPGDPNSFYGLFNRAPPGLEEPRLLALLQALFDAGALCTWRRDENPWEPDGDDFTPSPAEIALALRARPTPRTGDALVPGRLWYGLTESGGARWESYAKPDWDRYVAQEEWIDDIPPTAPALPATRLQQVQRIAGNEALGEALLQNDIAKYRIVDPTTIQRDTLEPWNATYWKRLVRGYRTRYSFWPEDRLDRRGAAISRYEDLDDLFRDTYDRWGPNWYTDHLTGKPRR